MSLELRYGMCDSLFASAMMTSPAGGHAGLHHVPYHVYYHVHHGSRLSCNGSTATRRPTVRHPRSPKAEGM